ncbi:hypothetical protein [Picrophilus oshimae]|uniref:Uncharacterized protein n=1 Tax=Picrophilus torridus (strain ATCC 700027 / DSM 9790 / JCM 10055 / NBRC 100828 / KAW 2/3) TaxID=1122961 RepID=A0A8G2FXF5_PICTO|nr:hypothetical protein [Picrophilus oshimae]SMD31223.1 hypothetical protein SAMN02745355_1147 [Picrophilus oshimae DSM 9789]
MQNQYIEIEAKLDDINKRKEELDKEVGNLEDPDVLKKIKNFNESFISLVKSIFDNNLKPENVNIIMVHEIKLTSDQKNTLKLLSEQAEEIKKMIEDMLSDYKLSEKRQALKDQIEKEMEDAKKEMDGFMAHNPQKVLQNVIDNIKQFIYQFQKGDITIDGGLRFGKSGIN